MTELAERPRRWRLPIWLVLALAFGGLTAGTATVIGANFYVAALRNALELAVDVGDTELSRIGSTVDAQLQPAADQARFLADYISRGHVAPGDEVRLRDLLLGSIGAVRQLSGVGFVRLDLHMVWAAAVAEGRSYVADVADLSGDPSIAALMRQAQTTRASFWAGPLALGDQEPLLIAISPVTGENGRFVGFVGAAVSLHAASVRLATLASGGRVPFVVTEAGRVVMHPAVTAGDSHMGQGSARGAMMPDVASGFDSVLAGLPWPPRNLLDLDDLGQTFDLDVATVTLHHQEYFVIFRRKVGYGASPWFIGYHVAQNWDEAVETINGAVPIAAILVGVALLLALWLGRAIGRPIREFADNARRIARLDLDTPSIRGSLLTELDMAAQAQGAMRNGLLWLRN